MTKKIIVTIVTLLIVAFVAINGKKLLDKRKEEIELESAPKEKSIKVPTVYGKVGEMREMRRFLAQLKFDKSVKISTKIAGYIEKVYVEESDEVTKGTLLAKIDGEEIESNIKLLKTTLAQQYNELKLAEQIFNRNQKLYNIGGLPKEQLDTSKVVMEGKKGAIDGTKEKIEQLEHQKNYLKIEAPFNGVIDTIFLYGGDLAVMGKPILTMSDGVKKLVFSYDLDGVNIKKGQKVFYKGENIGEVETIRTSAKQGLPQAEVILKKIPNAPVGSNITIDVLVKKVRGCIVPNKTLVHKENGTYIMVYKDDKFVPLKVEILLSNTKNTTISKCPKEFIAIGDETDLSKLPIVN